MHFTAILQASLPGMQETLLYVEITNLQKLCYKAVLERNRTLLLRGAGTAGLVFYALAPRHTRNPAPSDPRTPGTSHLSPHAPLFHLTSVTIRARPFIQQRLDDVAPLLQSPLAHPRGGARCPRAARSASASRPEGCCIPRKAGRQGGARGASIGSVHRAYDTGLWQVRAPRQAAAQAQEGRPPRAPLLAVYEGGPLPAPSVAPTTLTAHSHPFPSTHSTLQSLNPSTPAASSAVPWVRPGGTVGCGMFLSAHRMVQMLDLFEELLEVRGWGFERLDGSILGHLRQVSTPRRHV